MLVSQSEQTYLSYLLTVLPVCLVSFGFHGMFQVSSNITIVMVVVMKSIFIGTGLALVIYMFCQLAFVVVCLTLALRILARVSIEKAAMFLHY